ncbi:YKU80 [Candida pseudojiufengensis]|uniref:YKU80 n=1 Tax=Candida pseudojiufengensis TaxID=497109 RepID=UPI0022257C72|nr:YKU80 [Candida pseudojiufengensis]KAI5963604.1 YKU80 [Candida pseudojiufengensis]
MSNKEYTTIVLDASNSMNSKSATTESKTDFELALEFSVNYLTNQLLKNRKSDRYAFVIYTSIESKYIYNDGPITLSYVKEFYDASIKMHHDDTGTGDKADIISSFSDALQNQIANKFIRNIYIITNGLGNINEPNSLDYLNSILNLYTINTTCIVLNNENNAHAKEIIQKFGGKLDSDFNIYDYDEYMHAGPPVKLIGPRCVSDTYLSFAEMGRGQDNDLGVSLKIQIYPSIRCQNQVHGHEFIVDSDQNEISKVKRDTKYIIKKNSNIEDEVYENLNLDEQTPNEKEEDEEIVISNRDITPGFKYTQRNILPVSSELDQAATLGTTPGVNILGFISRANLPVAYLTEESNYVIPDMKLYNDNSTAFNSMVQALLDLDFVALIRFVQKPDDEVQICAGFPQEVKLGEKTGFVLIMNRLAMKEDEKMGNFLDLKKMKDDSTDLIMEDFIRGKQLNNDQSTPNVLDNEKAGLTQSKSFTPSITRETTLEKILLSSSPANKRFNHYVNKILHKSLGQVKSLKDFVREKDFIETYLTADETNALLNLDNVLDTKEEIYYKTYDRQKDNEYDTKLKNLLDVKFKVRKKTNKRKRSVEGFFGPETTDGFDEYFDVDDILNG